MKVSANLNENGQTVVGIASCIQVVLVFLGDVRHQHVNQSLHCMVERCRETLVPGELGDTNKIENQVVEIYTQKKAPEVQKRRTKNDLL